MIRVDNISKTYAQQTALAPVSVQFRPQETTVLIGASGCGKSTLLRIIAGLLIPDQGHVFYGEQELSQSTMEVMRRGLGYVIQDGGLFPHLTAQQNVTLLANFVGRVDIAARVHELAQLVNLSEETLTRYPQNLSGGQRQRVGIMRALMLDPQVLLLDEPLGALDPITRYELQTQLKAIFSRLQKTVILVTHDLGEAAYFGDEIILMDSGKILQKGNFNDLLEHPANDYVRDFVRAQRSPLTFLPECDHV